MTVEKDGSDFQVNCNSCSNYTTVEARGDFAQVPVQLKREGWKISKEGGEWVHTCPNCQGDEE